jgi:hypothetical protein
MWFILCGPPSGFKSSRIPGSRHPDPEFERLETSSRSDDSERFLIGEDKKSKAIAVTGLEGP